MVGVVLAFSTRHTIGATMLDFIKRMFGEGEIRARIACDDGSTGTAKVPYIGDIETMNEAELSETIRQQVFVKYGKRVTSVNIIGWS
jgi:hypothetical protein